MDTDEAATSRIPLIVAVLVGIAVGAWIGLLAVIMRIEFEEGAW